MRVGLNLSFLVPGETGGTEVVARELIPRLAAAGVELTCFVAKEAVEGVGPWTETRAVTVPVSARNRLAQVVAEQTILPALAARARIELLHSLANTAPAWGPFARVVTIHDLIHRTHPETHRGARAAGLRVLVPLAARTSHRVIAVSNATALDIQSELDVPGAKIDIVPNGRGSAVADEVTPESDLRDRLALGTRAVALSLSAKRAHKNLSRLFEAMALIPEGDRPVLVLPGYATAHEGELVREAARMGLEADVRFAGWVSQEDLEGLFALAELFVFPSLHEGFGLPVLEAMARGVPVACSCRGALREVADGAALLFDPDDPEAIRQAMETLLRDPGTRARLRDAGYARATEYTWERTAQLTIAAYDRALTATGRSASPLGRAR